MDGAAGVVGALGADRSAAIAAALFIAGVAARAPV